MKYNICLFFAILIFFIPVSVFSATSEETGFLNEINSAQSWAEIIEVVESNAGAINLDLSIYNSLTDKSKVTITLSGSKYQSLDEFIAAFNHAVEQAQKSSSSGGASGGGGSGGSTQVHVYPCIWYDISCTVSLPEGEVAPEGGLAFSICFSGEDELDDPFNVVDGTSLSALEIIIPEGSGSAEFSHSFPIRSNYGSIRGHIRLSDYDSAKYLSCFYTDAIAIDYETNVYVTIPYAERKICGLFRLPEGMEALNDDLQVNMDLSGDDISNRISQTLRAGEREAAFYIGVEAGEYTISYSCASDGNIWLQQISPDIEILYVDTSESDCTDLILTAKEQKYIEGYISLPDGEAAPEGGLVISVGNISVTMEQGESSVYYRTGLTSGMSLSCWVETENYPGTEFVGGYYAYDGVLSRNYYEMMIFDDAGQNLTIDFDLIAVQSVKGILSLSEPLNCEARVILHVESENRSFEDRIFYIEAGETSTPYTIEIDAADDMKCYVSWYMRPLGEGYLESHGTDEFIAEGMLTRHDITNLAAIEKAVLFKGTVSLPNGETADEDKGIFICIEKDNNACYDYSIISKGKNSCEYVFYADNASVADHAGEYTLFVNAEHLTQKRLYYNNGSLSFSAPSTINLENQTVRHKRVELHMP